VIAARNGSPVVGWSLLPRMNHNVASETRKVAASMSRAIPIPVTDRGVPPAPRAAITRPAAAGPRNATNWLVPWESAFALGSRVGSRIAGRMELAAGKKNASAIPNPSAKAYRVQTCTWPASTTAARTVKATRRAVFAATMTRRGDQRSVTAPPTSMRTARGIAITASTQGIRGRRRLPPPDSNRPLNPWHVSPQRPGAGFDSSSSLRVTSCHDCESQAVSGEHPKLATRQL
jgi:hypothetical protein